MAGEGAVLEGLSEGSKAGSAKSKKSSSTKVILYSIVGAVLAYGGYYLYKQHEANVANSTDTTNPSTVDTSSPGDAGIATGGATPGTETGDPFQVADPNSATGETYGQELSDLENQITTDNANSATLLTQLDALGTDISTIPGAGNNTGSQVSPGNSVPQSTTAAWSATVHAALVKDGLSPQEATTAINDYLNGSAITSGPAAQGIANQLSIIGAPASGLKNIIVAAGTKLPTLKTTAATTTGTAPDLVSVTSGTKETATQAKASPALEAAEKKVTQEQAAGNTKAAANAEANVATVKKNLAARAA